MCTLEQYTQHQNNKYAKIAYNEHINKLSRACLRTTRSLTPYNYYKKHVSNSDHNNYKHILKILSMCNYLIKDFNLNYNYNKLRAYKYHITNRVTICGN